MGDTSAAVRAEADTYATLASVTTSRSCRDVLTVVDVRREEMLFRRVIVLRREGKEAEIPTATDVEAPNAFVMMPSSSEVLQGRYSDTVDCDCDGKRRTGVDTPLTTACTEYDRGKLDSKSVQPVMDTVTGAAKHTPALDEAVIDPPQGADGRVTVTAQDPDSADPVSIACNWNVNEPPEDTDRI